MNHEQSVERLFEALVNGDREWARAIMQEIKRAGHPPGDVLEQVLWPTYEMVSKLHRSDQLSTLGHSLATKLLRTLVDQNASDFERRASMGRSVFAVCGPTESDELAAEMAVDLLEVEGFEVRFAGGGIASDEILARVQETQPDVLVIFASAPTDLPEVRSMIDTMNEVGACRRTQIVVGGGVFNRAEGLAEEIGADLWAPNPWELVEAMLDEPERRASEDQRTVGRMRRPKAA